MAVVDLGSTAVRFLLARITPDSGYRVLVEERVPTRLGGGAPGTLPREAIDETLRAVHRFFARHSLERPGPAHRRGRDVGGAGRPQPRAAARARCAARRGSTCRS